jgi:50S ribosomal subunit-associated GTPase HflX
MEVVSARGRNVPGTVSGEGETQLEMERRLLRDKEGQLRREIDRAQARRRAEKYF